MKVSILIPSVNRPETLGRCLEAVQKTTIGFDVEIVCSLSLGDVDSHAICRLVSPRCVITDNHVGLTGGTIAWNEAAQVCLGNVLAMIGDDAIVKEHWLKLALQILEQMGDGVVGLNDLSRTDGQRFSTHPIVTRQYLIQHNGGVLCVPYYIHYFVDVELCEHAKMLNAYRFAENALIDHQWKGNDHNKDKVYSWAMRYFNQDAQTYKERKARDFPIDFEGYL